MERVVIDEDERVCRWFEERMGYPHSRVRTAMGFEAAGALRAAVVFDNLSDNNVFAHAYSDVESGFPDVLLYACYLYAYVQLDLERVSLLIAEDNERAIHFVKKWGAEYESRIKAGTKRGDVLIYACWRKPALYERLKASAESSRHG